MRNAFSLVELSIVLVILGLLTGGILTGQNLIRAAELRKASTDVERYQTAVMVFRDKYFAIPGDMRNATDFWGAADSSGTGGECDDSLTDAGTGTQTCNGNGDGVIGNGTAYLGERYRFWQHLNNAGLIEGSYTGVAGPGPGTDGRDDVPGENIPLFPIDQAGVTYAYLGQANLDTNHGFNQSEGNFFYLAACCHSTWQTLDGRAFNSQEVWSIDKKVDDGIPYGGRFQASKGYWTGCMTSNTIEATYDLTNTDKNCVVTIEAY